MVYGYIIKLKNDFQISIDCALKVCGIISHNKKKLQWVARIIVPF